MSSSNDAGGGVGAAQSGVAAKITATKITAAGTVTAAAAGTPISLNTTTGAATAIRAIGGQATQVRVVMPTGLTQSMIKQLEGATGRTQITAIPAGNPRTVSNTSITVSRPVTQTTYLPRATVTATQMTGVGVGVATGQRLVTPIRPAAVGAQATVTGLTAAGSFVRGTAVSRNTNSPATSNTTTWMANTSGQVQLIRTIPHQSRQRIITTQGISGAAAGAASAGTVVANAGHAVQVSQAQSNSAVQSTIQAVASQNLPHNQQQTYVATLATVLPPRQHQATLVYPTNSTANSSPLSHAQSFNPSTITTGQRFAVATPISAATGSAAGPRQIRPIPLSKNFSATKLNTTSISIRPPNIPQLTPTAGGAVVSAANSPRSNTATGTSTTIPTTNLSATRIIQLQQQPGSTAQQLIGSTGRLTGNVMLQPIIVNTSGGGKIGIRPPVSMATKVQPSLTITQLGISKLPAAGANVLGQSNVAANIQSIGNVNTAGLSSSSASSINAAGSAVSTLTPTSITATNLSTAAGTIVNVSQAGQLLSTQNLVSSAAGGATVVPLAITTTRNAAGGNILTGTITPIKNANGITVGKVMTQAQVSAAIDSHNLQQSAAAASSSGLGGTAGSIVGSVSAKKMPGGSTIYYESVPASSVQVSTGVLSLTTTTVSSSTMSQAQQIVSSAYPSTHVSNSAATFTVVPSSAALQIPVSTTVSTGGTQIQAVPVRFNAGGQLTAVSSSAGDTLSTQSGAAQLVSSSGQQIIIPAGSQANQHMVIPLQTSIKVTSAANTASVGNATIVSNFIRKREADGSPIRAAKNLGPTLLSMSSSSAAGATVIASSASGSPAASSMGSTYSMASITTTGSSPASNNSSAGMLSTASNLTTEALARKDRAAAAAAANNSIAAAAISAMRPNRADSPASSDGSTTVSANSSPGVDQQLQDGNMTVHNRMAAANDSTHFNPINDLYANHHANISQQHSMAGTPASSRNSSLDQQHHVGSSSSVSSINAQRMNGGTLDCPPRKKSRRSTNDSQLSSHSQASLSLPPPQSINNSNNIDAASSQYGNGINYELSNNLNSASAANAATTSYSNHKNNNNVPATAGNKENAKPVEYYLKRPRNCTLLANYKQSWKAANNHFLRYSDVKPREERPPSVIDLANQDNVLHKINGWKLHLMVTQMQDLCQNETQGYDTLSSLLNEMETHAQNPDMERISDLLKGNMQRNRIIVDGINEAQNQMMKIFDHKSHVSDIIHRCASKRNFKKREKV